MLNRPSTLLSPSAAVFIAAGVALAVLPIAAAFKWTMFGLLLLAAALFSKRRLSAGRSCVGLGGLLGVGAVLAFVSNPASIEFRALALACFAMLACAFGTLFVNGARTVQRNTRAIPANGMTNQRPTVGEVIAARQKEQKKSLPAPRYIQPTWEADFRRIVGMTDFKKKLRQAGMESVDVKDRNGILLHGEPGNGKTDFAKALAGELGLEFIAIQNQTSKWAGETTQNLFNQLNEAVTRSPCVVFIDEADTIFGARSDGAMSGHRNETNAIVNRLLTFLVDYRKSGVVFVAATNFIDMIDPAIRRPGRFDFIFEVPNPDLPARLGLLEKGLERHAPQVNVERAVLESLAKRWDGFNAATLISLPAQIPNYLKAKKANSLDFDDFMAMLRLQQGIANRVPETTKSFVDMAYPAAQKATIKGLIERMDKAFEIEESGGAAPSGVLFYGDPGTGKTETARMIAKETKWAFFPVGGSELARDPDLIEKTLRKVKNARPAIIFIDEADDLLGDRANSPFKAATNKLLEAMDGPLGRMNDLLWIASTNFAEASDAAVIRSGRFTEKVKFHKPSDQHLLAFAKAFFGDPKRNAVMAVTWEEVSEVLEGCSIADANGILMQAWNMTLTSKEGVDKTNPVTLQTLRLAREALQIS